MEDASDHRRFKTGRFAQLARIGKALASPHRLEFLELLAQSERTVESLADEVGMSLANASQHLLTLRESGMVKARKQGLFVHYSLAHGSVFDLTRTLQSVAETQLAEFDRLVREEFGAFAVVEPVGMDDLLARATSGDVTILDTRPLHEYDSGHIAGAISVPVDQLQQRLQDLPADREYVAYCRGKYCVYADRAVEFLHAHGRNASRLAEGFPEWKAAGLPVSSN